MKIRSAMFVLVLAAVLALPSAAYAAFTSAASPYATSTATPNQAQPAKPATQTYDLDWTLPTLGKSGCMVCHGDKNLVRVMDGKIVSLYVDTATLQNSAHANVPCTQCHLDFAYKTPHQNIASNGDEWKAIAGSTCENCHRFEFGEYTNSVHTPTLQPGQTSTLGAPNSSAPGKPKPLCGDCHGGHAIPSKTDTAGVAAVRASALDMCGKCHVTAASNYDDYYHGAAYRRGAPDAPACWQCHGTHLILLPTNQLSKTNPDNLVATCSQCHKNAGDSYVQQYASFVHTRQSVVQRNALMSAMDTATAAIENVFHRVLSAFGKGGS